MSPKLEQSYGKDTPAPNAPRSVFSKKVFFTYSSEKATFQSGYLGADKSTLEGVLNLRYTDSKPIFAKKITLSFVGKEYVFFAGTLMEGQEKIVEDDESGVFEDDEEVSTTTISKHTAKRQFYDHDITLWKSQSKGHYEGVKYLDLPFKIDLPDNLPPSVTVDKGCGRIYYTLKAVISRRPIDPNSRKTKKVIKVVVPIGRFMITPQPSPSHWCVKEEGPAKPHAFGYDVSLTRSTFGPGESLVVPVRLFSHEPHVYLKKLSVGIKEYHEFRTDRFETLTKRYIVEETIQADKVPISSGPDNEMFLEVKLDIPPERQLSYNVDTTYLTISHKLRVKISLGRAPDIHLSKKVQIQNIVSEDEVYPKPSTPIAIPQDVITTHEPIFKPKRESYRRLSPFFPLFSKIQDNDPVIKKFSIQLQKLQQQLRIQITDSKDPKMVYNSRSIFIPTSQAKQYQSNINKGHAQEI